MQSFFSFFEFSFPFKPRQSRYQLHWSFDHVRSCCIRHEINRVEIKKNQMKNYIFLPNASRLPMHETVFSITGRRSLTLQDCL